MKIKYIIAFLLIFSYSFIQSQIYYGLKVGANFSNVSGDIDNTAIKTLAHFGGLAEYLYSDLLSFQGEVSFSFQGFQDKDDSNLKTTLNYATVAIMGKYFITDFITLDAGPQVGFLLEAHSSTGHEEFTDLNDNFKSLDYGLAIGGTYEIDHGVFISLRYYQGLANIIDFDGVKATNSNIQLSVGYKFY